MSNENRGSPLTSSQRAELSACYKADLTAVETIVKRAGTSFAHGMRVLPRQRRYGMYAVYAFCRVVDDIADGDAGVSDPLDALQTWRVRIDQIYDGVTHDSLDRVLQATIKIYNLEKADFYAVIDGMLMDLETPIVAPTESELDLYCDRVASAVGRLSVRVFGAQSQDAARVAYHLGRALQLTNILRDVQEDADRGRLYLPRELLQRFGIPLNPQEALFSPNLDQVARILAKRARDHYRLAKDASRKCPRGTMRPASMMAASYLPVLRALETRGWARPDQPIRVSKIGRMSRSLLAGLG